jgi:hypothetical protein
MTNYRDQVASHEGLMDGVAGGNLSWREHLQRQEEGKWRRGRSRSLFTPARKCLDQYIPRCSITAKLVAVQEVQPSTSDPDAAPPARSPSLPRSESPGANHRGSARRWASESTPTQGSATLRRSNEGRTFSVMTTIPLQDASSYGSN